MGTEENYAKMLRGESGLKMCEMPDLTDRPLPVQRVDAEAEDGLSRLETMMKKVVEDVVKKSGIETSSDRTGIIFSTTKGNIGELGIEKPEEGSRVYLQVMAERVGRAVGYRRRPIVVSNACISGVVAVVVAQRLIRAGRYDDVIVVGGDEVTDFTTSGFLSFKSVSERPCRPYDQSRDGLSLGEAVGAIVVSRDAKKSAGIVVSGGAMSNDANHISGPSRTGEPLAEAIEEAMREAGVGADDISFINAHGTATVYNDEMESKAMNIAHLQAKPMNSLKPYIGHTLGASGVVEIALAAEEMLRGEMLGTPGFETLGTPMPLNISSGNRKVEGRHCVKSASGFGGCNAAIVLSREDASAETQETSDVKTKTLREVSIKDGKLSVDGKTIVESDGDFGELAREIYHKLEPNMKFFKMTDMCKMGYLAAEYLLKDISYEPYEIGIVMWNKSSSLDADLQHWRIQKRDNMPASPGAFVYTLANIVTGEIAIRHGIKGETTFFISDDRHDEETERYARLLLSEGRYRYIVSGWCEMLEGQYELELKIETI